MKFPSISFLSSSFLLSLLAPAVLEAVDYQEEIRPILNKKCYKCHSGPRAKGKLRMDSENSFADRIGGDDPVIVPGNPAESLLAIKAGLPRSDGEAMPPPPARERGAEPMTSTELNLVKQWISEGASFEKGAAPTPAVADEPAMEEKVHQWTNVEGKTLEAEFAGTEGTNVLLKLADGSTIPYDYHKLSPESQELAKKLHAATQ